MAEQRLWAPWRLEYIKGPKTGECIFCSKPELGDDESALIVHRGERCYVILNAYPYNNGHVMVTPFEHKPSIEELDEAHPARADGRWRKRSLAVLRDTVARPRASTSGSTRGRSPGRRGRSRASFTWCRAGRPITTSCLWIADTRVLAPEPSSRLVEGAEPEGSPMAVDPGIFKAYDVRGIYGEQIDEDVAYRIGRAFAQVLAELRGRAARRPAAGARPRHAARRRPALAERYAEGIAGRGRRRARRRDGGHGDALLPRRLARPGRRADVHGVAQPEGRTRARSWSGAGRSRCPATRASASCARS